jgi:hypothetical protein
VETGPDDEWFAAWCGVWAATQRADRPDEAPRPAGDHVALGRRLTAPGGSLAGTHRAAVAGPCVARCVPERPTWDKRPGVLLHQRPG